MKTGRTSLAGAVLVAAVALTSCAGIGAVDKGDVTRAAQQRGGGITTALVDDAIAAVVDETGADPLLVHSVTARLAQVTIVVPATDGSGGREAWTYGTSGLYGGRGLEGPAVAEEPGFGTFPVAVGDLDVDGLADQARDQVGPGRWVDAVTVARLSEGADPITTVVVAGGAGAPSNVQFDAAGELLLEGVG